MDHDGLAVYSSVDSDSEWEHGNQSDSDQSWLDQLQLASEVEISKVVDGPLADSPEENWQAGLAFQTAARQIPQIRRRKRRPGAGVQRGSSRGEYKKRSY